MPKGEPAPGCREVELVRLILSSYQTAYAKFHCEEKRKVVESHNMAIGYASAELALALQSVPSSPGHGKPITEREIESWAAAPSDAGQPVEWPECYDFYQLMQIYRHMPVERVADVRAAYEAVKEWLRSVAAPPALEKLRELETTWIARSEMTPSCRNCSLEQCAYEMCADELHDVLTELEPKAPPPRTGQEEQD